MRMPGGTSTRLESDPRAANVSGLTRDRPITRRFPSGFTVYPSVSRHDVFPRLEQRINAHSAGKPISWPFVRALRSGSFYFHISFSTSSSAFQRFSSPLFPRPRLLERGEARRVHEIPVDMIHQCSVLLRFGLHLLPFRIGLESGPILLRLLTARMLQDVDKQILRTRRIFGRPVTDALHVVPFEDRVGV